MSLFSLGSSFGLQQQQQQQQISPWFPSVPAIACGASLFSFNIEGLPDKGVNVPINDEELTALQIQLDKDNRGLSFTSDDDVSGKILVGKDNIKTNQGDDFDVKNLFNNCRTLVFSSSGDVNIKTPPPATPVSDKVNTVILGNPPSQSNPFYPVQSFPPAGSGYQPPVILSHSSYVNSIGNMHIVGEVLNQAPVTARFVQIIATLYNANGQVIGTESTYADPPDLAPGQRAPFDILVLEGSVPIDQVSSYGLIVDSQ